MKVELLSFLLLQALAGTTDDRTPIHSLPSADYIIYSCVGVVLVLLGGLMSGLTVGLLGIDEISLELKIASGTKEEKAEALKVLKIISEHHLLLVTLLLANALAMEALPLCLDTMFNTEISLIVSVTFVLAFGEVIPQSLCTGSNQIKIACRCVPIVRVFIFILFPIAYPISKLLDWIFGLKAVKRKLGDNELKTFIGIQKAESYDQGGLDNFQVKMMSNTMDLNKPNIDIVLIPLDKMPMANLESPLGYGMVSLLCHSNIGYVTVYKDTLDNICGYFRMQKVFGSMMNKEFYVKDIGLEEINTISVDTSLLNCLKELESYNCDIVYVTDIENSIIGMVRKQDILNRILSSTNIQERVEIAEISGALVKVLENKDHRKSGTRPKSEIIIRKKEFGN